MSNNTNSYIKSVRNFAIIAHIDHGKSTLADRFIQHTNTIEDRNFQDQLLDDMDLERERGITIKSHPVRLKYLGNDKQEYQLNLIDTPGHVDFSYEVSRSLSACEGAILIIDAAQGVQAQTVANVNLAIKLHLEIIPVINKIDLPAADVQTCLEQLEEILAIPAEDALQISAKADIGIREVLEAVVKHVPPPSIGNDKIIRALVFDSIYDIYRGVVTYIRVATGVVSAGTKIKLMSNDLPTEIKEVGVFTPQMESCQELRAGEVGYIITALKNPADIKVGDTITGQRNPSQESLTGFQEVHPMVFSGVYPIDTRDYEALKLNISKLQLNDSAFTAQPESSLALGAGFRCGFLGLLHMEIIQERLHREYNMDIILTYPSVIYHVYMKSGKMLSIDNPTHLPDPSGIDRIEEPIIKAQIIMPITYLGGVMNLIMEKRGIVISTENVDHLHVMIIANLPMHEIVLDFYDKLKSITKGYGSMDYEMAAYKADHLVKLEMMVNGEPVDAFASIVHFDQAPYRARKLAKRLKEVIPQHQFKIAIQGAIGGKIIAREDVRALRKNVTAKCYGGDITRKRKLLEKQKEGKKRMKAIGKVHIPQDAFVEVLKSSDN